LVLPPAVEQREPLLFIARPTSELLIHDRLRAPLEAALLADVAFAPLDTVAHPAIGIQIAAIRVQLDASPDDVELWSELARRCGMAYQYRGGLDAIDHALALAPDAADFWRKRGVFLANLRRDDEALAAYERAWNLCERERAETGRSVEPQDWAWQGAAEVLRWQARFAEALAWSERGVRLFPQAVIAWYELGAAYLGLGDLDNALAAFERAPDHGGAATHDEQLLEAKGEVLNKLGRHEEALRLYDRALEFTPINFPMRRGQIEALRALGRHHKAGKAEVELQRLETRVRPKFW
jgi:tetratricopeptide (TPR) repeat protein